MWHGPIIRLLLVQYRLCCVNCGMTTLKILCNQNFHISLNPLYMAPFTEQDRAVTTSCKKEQINTENGEASFL